MKDIHNHLIVGIDDGSKSYEDSIRILKYMEDMGYTDICLTPHYVYESKYDVNNKGKTKLLKELKRECEKNNININLYLGNEIFITDNIEELIKKGDIAPLNNSKYLLLELSVFQEYPNTKLIIYNLIQEGYKVILAHPERYTYFDKSLTYVKELKEMGVLMQCNYLSLFGRYGKSAKDLCERILKNGLADFLATDIHHDEDLHPKELRKKIKKFVKTDEEVENLLTNNFDKILN